MFLPNSNNGKEFPRRLTPLEHELIFNQLPDSSDAYRSYRERIDRMQVVGLGKRGAGHLVLGEQKPLADVLEMVTPVFAVGGAESPQASLTIVIHEIEAETISVELMTLKGSFETFSISGAKMWSISDWKAGDPCPKCSARVREVKLPVSKTEQAATLVVCKEHRGIWVSDGSLKINRIIPVTAFLSELEAQRNLREGGRTYHPVRRVFDEIDGYPDSEFVHAFVLYNKFWRKMELSDAAVEAPERQSFAFKVASRFAFKNRKGKGKH